MNKEYLQRDIIIKRDQKEILDLKNTISELKNLPEGFNSRFNKAKEKLANLKAGQLK